LAITLQELLDAKDKDRSITRREFLELTAITVTSVATLSLPSSKQDGQAVATFQKGSYSRVIMAGMAQPSRVTCTSGYEGEAQIAHAAGNWPKAEALWILIAGVEAQEGNVPKWTNAMLSASQMALNLGKFDIAKARLSIILRESGISAKAEAEALLRLGWVYFEEEKYNRAYTFLSQGRSKCEELLRKQSEDPDLEALLEMAHHFHARIIAEQAYRNNNRADALLEEALQSLENSYNLAEKYEVDYIKGFDFLRQVPIFSYQQNKREANYSLDQTEAYLGSSGTVQGHINYHKALLSRDDSLRRVSRTRRNLHEAEDFLELADAGFTQPIFCPRGLADVHFERCTLLEDKESPTIDDLEQALEHVLVASILHEPVPKFSTGESLPG
jgi:hypothetical protein